MTVQEIRSRIQSRLNIDRLLPMQEDMATISMPVRSLLCAPTGSGKTLAFAIALLRALPSKGTSGVKALVIAPTRELVLQIFDIVRVLAAPEYKTVAVYGGHSFAAEAKSLEAAPDIVVGTPGRILDHINRGRLELGGTPVLIIDEYDKSLELGFADDMRRICGRMKKVANLVLTSATDGEIPAFVGAVDNRLDYSNASADTPRPDVEVFRVDSPDPDKLETLDCLLRALGNVKVMVFVNHRDAAERVFNYLNKRHFPVVMYHGGLEQQYRERALILFENGTLPVMVCTDLAARGLDIEGVGAVVHYHLPASAEAWTHRNGRTARMGKQGSAYAIISAHDKAEPYLQNLSQMSQDTAVQDGPARSQTATLYLNAGRKEKISRGDIAGFLIQKGGLSADEVGKIDVKDHCAYVAVPASKARETVVAVAPFKIKNTKVRVTQIKN